MRIQVLKAMLVVALCLLAQPVFAAARSTPTDDQSYDVEINKGRLIKLPGAATSVIVADPTIADVQVVSPTMVYVNGKAIGETTIFAVGSHNTEILHATIKVAHNVSGANKAIHEIYPDTQVKVHSFDGGMVVDGMVDSPSDAENIRQIVAPMLKEKQSLVNMLHTSSSNQVNLRVRIAEVQRSQLKRFGINFQNLLSSRNFVVGLGQGRGVVDSSDGFLRNGSDNSLFGSFRTKNADLNGVVDALETQGVVTILAEPNLTALSGKSASFLAGGEYPIQTVDNNTVGIEYKPFGVSLNFTPTVISKDKISLLVNPEVSELSSSSVTVNNQSVPIIDTRRATTTVELGSGQSFAIAGLLKNNRSNSINQFPWLGDLPVLGALFRSVDFQNDQTELVILVTPYIVHAVDSAAELSDPTEGIGMPSDMELILFGKLYGQYGDVPQTRKRIEEAVDNGSVPRLHGPAGYILK